MSALRRRDLLIGGAAAAGVLGLESCTGGGGGASGGGNPVPVPPPITGMSGYTLNVQYATMTLAGRIFRTRTYNGSIPGPTFGVTPGQTLNINVVNSLPPNPAATVPAGADPTNNPHSFNTTNLHVHGLQVVPHIFDPLGTTNPAATMIAIQPGSSYQYTFQVPNDQPPGLYWYHPHHHGSTDVEVSGGMAGLIIVGGAIDHVPEIAQARDVRIAVQTLQANPDPTTPNGFSLEYSAYCTPQNNGYNPRPQYLFMLVNGQMVSQLVFPGQPPPGTPAFQQTNFAPPQIQMAPGEVIRLRFLNGTNELLLPLQLPGFEVFVIAYDGVNLLAPQQVSQTGNSAITVPAGGRVELLVRAPSNGTSTLAALPITDPGVHPWPLFQLAQFNVVGPPLSMNIPASLPTPTREYPLIADGEVAGMRNVIFNDNPSTALLFGTALTINGVVYNEPAVMFNLPVGSAEQWTIGNAMPEGHPFHLHTNSFEVHSVTGSNGTTNYSPPFICDTVWVPGNGQVVIRARYKQWRGKDVFHCHKLSHEDQGMIANTLLT
jgi:FtsP/CotA-like multicopper oxidase with cupredoxin domain